jgi:hypothetical protein
MGNLIVIGTAMCLLTIAFGVVMCAVLAHRIAEALERIAGEKKP